MFESEALSQIVRTHLSAELVATFELPQGASAQVVGIVYHDFSGVKRKAIVRSQQWESDDGVSAPEREFAIHNALEKSPIPIPRALALDLTCKLHPKPYLIIEYVEHDRSSPKSLYSAAQLMAQLHEIDAPNLPIPKLQSKVLGLAQKLKERSDPGSKARLVAERVCSMDLDFLSHDSVLLHGDIWPGNWLTSEGNIVALIDWEDACYGNRLFDLANSRLEYLYETGETGLHELTQAYLNCSQLICSNLAAYDLVATLKPYLYMPYWGLSSSDFDHMQTCLVEFTDRALAG